MTITVTLEDEIARIVERQIGEGRYPDAQSAVASALLLLDDAAFRWDDIDAEAVKRMIAESDAEGGEIPFDEVRRRLIDKDKSP
jgi:Arc/MetJ-type ribon-helix-helix transcriptional regulator